MLNNDKYHKNKSGTSELYITKLNIYRLLKTATRKSQTRSKIRRAQSGAEKPSSRTRTEKEQKIPSQDVQARKVAKQVCGTAQPKTKQGQAKRKKQSDTSQANWQAVRH